MNATIASDSKSVASSKVDGEVLIRVENVSKRFCRDLKKSLFYGIQDIASDLFGRDQSHAPLRKDEFWANDNISFEVRRGECLGLIGRNGAGKTTLLKMLNGLIKPDTGRVEMRGHVGALIALGAGFNPILTGRENVYIAGAVLGLSRKEVDEKYDEIVEFAEVEDFMDTPVQSFSSGMQVRLGFAVATAMKPDILLLDEVLAVGDSQFRNKCYRKVGELLSDAAVILVTHNMAHIARVATRAMVLGGGQSLYLGDTTGAIRFYNELDQGTSTLSEASAMVSSPVTDAHVKFEDLNINSGDALSFRITAKSMQSEKDCFFYIYFFDESGVIAAQWNSLIGGSPTSLNTGMNSYDFDIGPISLRTGAYLLSVIMKDETGIKNLVWTDQAHKLRVNGSIYTEGPYQVSTITSRVVSTL